MKLRFPSIRDIVGLFWGAFLRAFEFAVFCESDDLIGGMEKRHQESSVTVPDAVFLEIIFEKAAASFAEDAPGTHLPAVLDPFLGFQARFPVEFVQPDFPTGA